MVFKALKDFMFTEQPNSHEPCLFWIDTICVPVGTSAHEKAARNKAVGTMRDIYERATVVLVLDSSLLQIRSDTHITERLMRIVMSPWMSRIWTLQEGVLAQELWFQFEDKAMESSRLLLSHMEDVGFSFMPGGGYKSWNDTSMMSAQPLRRLTIDIPKSLHGGNGKTWTKSLFEVVDTRWRSINSATSDRTTSKHADEPICVAVLLGLGSADIAEILEVPKLGDDAALTTARMLKFWHLQRQGVPASILFSDTARLKVSGYRWAPARLCGLNIPVSHTYFEEHLGIVSPRGLEVEFPGFIPKGDFNSFQELCAFANLILECLSNTHCCYHVRSDIYDEDVSLPARPAFIMEPARWSSRFTNIVLVDIKEETDEIIYADFVSQLTTLLRSSNLDEAATQEERKQFNPENRRHLSKYRELFDIQKWCIG